MTAILGRKCFSSSPSDEQNHLFTALFLPVLHIFYCCTESVETALPLNTAVLFFMDRNKLLPILLPEVLHLMFVTSCNLGVMSPTPFCSLNWGSEARWGITGFKLWGVHGLMQFSAQFQENALASDSSFLSQTSFFTFLLRQKAQQFGWEDLGCFPSGWPTALTSVATVASW